MIIEFFGPAGSGKTTMAQALADRLRGKGYMAKVVVCYQPRNKGGGWDIFGINTVFVRILSAIFSIFKIYIYFFRTKDEVMVSRSLTRLLPAESKIWRIRLWQYILRLSSCWRRAKRSADITIFDQGLVQAVGSLAMFSGAANDALLAQALGFIPKADLAVRMAVPREVVETRLHRRMMFEPAAERIFEADVAVNMKSFRIFENIGNILSGAHRHVISVKPVDQNSTLDSLRIVEQAILAQLSQSEALGIKAAETEQTADRAPAWTGRDINNHSEEHPPVRGAAADVAPLSGISAPSVASSAQQSEVGRRLVHASVYALLVYIGGAGLTSLAQLLIARLVGATSYGVYSYALAWSTVLAYLATLGFNVSLLRFVPAYGAAGTLDLARGVIIFALRWSLLAATMTGWAGAGLVFLFGKHLNSELEATMLLGMAAVPLITAYALGTTLVRAFGGVVSALLPERIARDGLLLALLSGAAVSGWTLDAQLAMMAVIASSAVTVGLVLVTATRLWPAGLRDVQATYAAREWWSAVPPIMLIAGLDVFISRTGVVLLGWTGQIREAGIFALGLNVALLVSLSRFAVGTMFSPAAAELHTRKDHETLQHLFSRATVLCFGGAVAVAVPLLLVTEPLLSWFGEEFASGAPVARILIVGYALTALFGPQQNLLTMTGHEWAAAMTMVAGAVANVAACAVGMALGGTIGAAAGVTLALVVWNLAMAIFIRKRMLILPGLVIAALAIRPGQLKARWG